MLPEVFRGGVNSRKKLQFGGILLVPNDWQMRRLASKFLWSKF